MKLWCLFFVSLLLTTSTSSFYFNDYNDALINYQNTTHQSSIFPSSDLLERQPTRRSVIVKRSQRNANILYRYCRRNGEAPNFCLKYAVRMIFATGY